MSKPLSRRGSVAAAFVVLLSVVALIPMSAQAVQTPDIGRRQPRPGRLGHPQISERGSQRDPPGGNEGRRGRHVHAGSPRRGL